MTDSREDRPSRFPRRLGCLIGLLVVVVGVGIITLPFLSILFNVLIPPKPPLPNVSLSEINHTNYDYGVDEWVYDASADPCDLLAYYQSIGAACNIAPLQCSRSRETSGNFTAENYVIARCDGMNTFSQFSMTWWALISREQADLSVARLDVYREINWLGVTRVETPTPNNTATSP
ncbi:MAG: hypothetical protein U0670_15215 [Anaerolineae bacterium]